MKSAILGVILLLTLALTGCSESDDTRVVGTYKIDPASMSEEGKPPNPMAEQMAKSISLELKADHTYALTMFMAFNGTWSIENGNVQLSPPKVPDDKKPSTSTTSQKPMVLSISSDSKTLTMVPEAGVKVSGGKMVFVRSS